MNRAIRAVVETAIYVDDLVAAEDFYLRVLGLPVIRRDSQRHVFFRVGEANVLLAFLPDATQTADGLPAHGAVGPGHFALGVDDGTLDDWRAHLAACGVAIEQEVQWPNGGRSIYFRDPAENSVELITPNVWDLPSGW